MNTLIDKIRASVIGENNIINTSFGQQPLVYADYTASGRSLGFIEDYIRQQVLPFYANTHTETSYTGAQTSTFREEARQEIRSAINAREEDQVIFCGSGATAAINKLIDMMNIRLPYDLDNRYKLQQHIPEDERPVVFIGPYEHHSNELPWRESIAELVVIPLTHDGLLDLVALEAQLKRYSNRPMKIGSFSAASNVTGLKTDIEAVAQLLHRYDALSFWDYAAAAPYVGIDMRDSKNTLSNSSKDAVFISPHKFIGGPGTPGILVVNQRVINNLVPAVPGGGTVLYVTPEDHRYITNIERREEGGTPAIIESIRAGLVFKLQQAVGTQEIERREALFVKHALTRWSTYDNIEILGNLNAPRLSIISLRIKHNDKDLHYGFVVALLNDLFGIQARGGCSCAGPYGHSLLGMDMAYSKALEEQLLEGQMILRPGWVRLNFNYFISEESFNYIVRAIELIAQYGCKLLPFYNFDQSSGVWRYQDIKSTQHSSLAALDFNYINDNLNHTTGLPSDMDLSDYMSIAEQEIRKNNREGLQYELTLPEAAEKLRWFALPQEARVLE
ncbi:aminotransferase class V-fold PLP-dependent enzyme [Neptunomonas sp.]|uniref:aminotransferase class V-fold PLP-dependent enzyme n=1 Tax=Neptunomonas sp. TaxID=1971898 RepID=UPI0025E2C7B2|nr:aminotransferase class V-fold PLP-dependent enzyme [Neptunomonas sp.]